jgi:hypothetical protein
MDTSAKERLEREVEREREQRHRNDEARTGAADDEELRLKDARESTRSAGLHR